MTDDDDTTANNAWDGKDRRANDRRKENQRMRDLENMKVSSKRKKNSDRRKAQVCFSCRITFTPKGGKGCVCENCKKSALRMGTPVGWF